MSKCSDQANTPLRRGNPKDCQKPNPDGTGFIGTVFVVSAERNNRGD